MDLFGQDLLGDFMDAPTPASTEKSTTKADQSDVDLFADATFVSATSPTEAISSSGGQVFHLPGTWAKGVCDTSNIVSVKC